jgi:cell division topological specificity factor
MSWLERIFGKKEKSGSLAKNRLQMVLTHDRASISPGMLELIKDDIISVIAQHLEINADDVQINLTQSQQESRLVAEIPLQARARRSIP